jgi:hypothetical protein
MVARSGRSKRAKTRRKAAGAVAVPEEQRLHLIECCASFAAARFRPERPGGYRVRDRLEAASRIDEVLDQHKPK